jgi:hypothetical protein
MLCPFHAIGLPFYLKEYVEKEKGLNRLLFNGLMLGQAKLLRTPRSLFFGRNRKFESTDGIFLQVHGVVYDGVIRDSR